MFFAISIEEEGFLSYRIVCKKVFFHLVAVILYDMIRSLYDRLGRSIIFFEIDNDGFRIVSTKRENILDIRSTPRINSLPIIANHTDITSFTRENMDDLILETIRILIFIDHEKVKSCMKV